MPDPVTALVVCRNRFCRREFAPVPGRREHFCRKACRLSWLKCDRGIVFGSPARRLTRDDLARGVPAPRRVS